MARKRTDPEGRRSDAAEEWLRANDPNYASNKRKWVAPKTDALSKILRGERQHHTLEGLIETPDKSGNYMRPRNPERQDE